MSKKFVILDDSELILEIASAFVEELGYTAVGFTTGQEVLDYLKNTPNEDIAGMLFDLVIPEGPGGEELIKRISFKGPVFVTSGYSDDPVMINPTEYGFKDSIEKPFLKEELQDMLKKYL
jgi:FixJ family two-component response regulator